MLKRKSTFTVKKFLCGASKNSNIFLNLLEDYRKNEADARTFKCNEKILTNVESVSQRYITIFIYASVFFFYFTALLIPLTEESDSCIMGHSDSVYYYYGIYMIVSTIMEIVNGIYL